MYQRTELNPTAATLRPLFALPMLLVSAIRELLSAEPVTIAPATVCDREDAIRRFVLASDPTAKPGTERFAVQVVRATIGETLLAPADVPVADLAPVLQLGYTPTVVKSKPASKPRAARKPKATAKPAPKAKVMPTAARSSEPLFVRRARGYVPCDKAKPRQGEQLWRCVGGKGKATRYAAV